MTTPDRAPRLGDVKAKRLKGIRELLGLTQVELTLDSSVETV